jgi:hypothetical protein
VFCVYYLRLRLCKHGEIYLCLFLEMHETLQHRIQGLNIHIFLSVIIITALLTCGTNVQCKTLIRNLEIKKGQFLNNQERH